jgi:hypothetical protein
MPNASITARLARWFQSCCNGEWEHELGINIETLDNPGWSVTVDLEGTPLEEARFANRSEARSETDWIECRVQAAQFQGFGGTEYLEELLGIFLDWAESARA